MLLPYVQDILFFIKASDKADDISEQFLSRPIEISGEEDLNKLQTTRPSLSL